MAIGRWKSVGLNVTDLQQGLSFWSQVLGWTTTGRDWHGWLGYLSDPASDNFMILNVTTKAPVKLSAPSRHETNRVHIDIWPNDGMDTAIGDILAIGGSLRKPPSLYPRPGSHGDERPAIDWAVMQDPFGNEFCIVEELTSTQQAAAMASTATDDQALRVAAGASSIANPPWRQYVPD